MEAVTMLSAGVPVGAVAVSVVGVVGVAVVVVVSGDGQTLGEGFRNMEAKAGLGAAVGAIL